MPREGWKDFYLTSNVEDFIIAHTGNIMWIKLLKSWSFPRTITLSASITILTKLLSLCRKTIKTN